ncbi:NADase-type glycan-binding domain-containing protein [Streptomyces millisiae]|uniref:Zinc ribbon domain-containing protein n=1 Tax=Streptomyces millisiae TaxID=3075542 RepID=A0ABU2LVF4_9ACTN|nr:zinc ribbon domain-containing protein [Streptomyces sp. DSM 44918]MDT0321577.1 zinc ribbon domain-containing protein [Streptomyces sp. DSM 44918]
MSTENCAECGARAEPGQAFCDACGTVLGWTDTSARAGVVASDAATASGGDRTGPRQSPGATRTVPSAAAIPPADSAPEAPRTSEADTAPPTPAATTDDEMTDRARRLLVPVADPVDAEAPTAVSPVLPGRPDATRPQVQPVTKEPGVHGGPPCPWCGTANRPDRHYCARCAMPMAGDEETRAARRPWWRRILDGRNREAPWAGERPRLRRTFEHLVRWLVAALVLTLLIILAVHLPDGVRATRDHFTRRGPVEPERFHALHSYEDHPAELAFDKLNDTWWGPGVSQSGEGEWIEAGFAEPTRLLDVIITPGVSPRADQLRESARPHRVEARITTQEGSTTTRELTLDPGLGPQRRQFRAEGVTSVRFTILSSYGAAADRQVAIAEIEFFGPSSGTRL